MISKQDKQIIGKDMVKYKKVFENDEFIVVNKPAGLLVHGSDHIKEETLVDQLLVEYPALSKVGEDPARPGIMHRLDRLASGLLVVAKTEDSFANLKNQFKKRTIEKYYTTLVFGNIERDSVEIDFPLIRSTKGNKMAAIPATVHGVKNEEGRNASTRFEVVKRFINFTLLKVKIKTGRTHQIRAHMAAYGNPIVGDEVYSTKKTKAKNKKINLGRIFLVADKLSFVDLKGEKQTFEIELPEELKELLKVVK